LSGGDVEFFARVRRAGHAITYDPAAGVRHRVGPERLTRRYFDRRAFGQGQTDMLLQVLTSGAGAMTPTRRRDLANALVRKLLVLPRRRRARRRLWYHYIRGRRAALRSYQQRARPFEDGRVDLVS
jgi:hypothetical protein